MKYLTFLDSLVKIIRGFEETECNDDDYYNFYIDIKSLVLYDKTFVELNEKQKHYLESIKWINLIPEKRRA